MFISKTTLHINGVDECTIEALNNLDLKKPKGFEDFIQEISGFIYFLKLGKLDGERQGLKVFLNLHDRNSTKRNLQKIVTNYGEILISKKKKKDFE